MSAEPSQQYKSVINEYVDHFLKKDEDFRPATDIVERNMWAMAECDYAYQSGKYSQLVDDLGLPKMEADKYKSVIQDAINRYKA